MEDKTNYIYQLVEFNTLEGLEGSGLISGLTIEDFNSFAYSLAGIGFVVDVKYYGNDSIVATVSIPIDNFNNYITMMQKREEEGL